MKLDQVIQSIAAHTVCINAVARTESLPAFPQAKKLGPQRYVFGRIPVLPRASDVTQYCTANTLAQSLVLPALERIGVKGAAVDNNHEDVLLKLFRNQKFSEFKSASVTCAQMRTYPETTCISRRGFPLGRCYMVAEHVLSPQP